MAEEVVELGFEGLDKITDKYFDRAYDSVPPLRKKTREQQRLLNQQNRQGQHGQQAQKQQKVQDKQQQENRENRQGENGKQQQKQQYQEDQSNRQYLSQNPPRHPDKGYATSRGIKPGFAYDPAKDPQMYAPDGGQERYGRDDRRYEDERSEYRSSGPGFKVSPPSRGRDENNGTRGMQVEPYQQQPQRGCDQGRGRPQSERRGSSWSPPRPERQDREKSRRRRSGSSSPSGSSDIRKRLIATVSGALVGGIAGNQATKGKKYDTIGTIAGAILGGVGAREASEKWDDRKKKKSEQSHGPGRDEGSDSDEEKGHRRKADGDDRRSDRRRDDRYDRDERGDKYDREERGDRYDRQERGDRYDREERGDRYDREERGDRYDRDDRRSGY